MSSADLGALNQLCEAACDPGGEARRRGGDGPRGGDSGCDGVVTRRQHAAGSSWGGLRAFWPRSRGQYEPSSRRCVGNASELCHILIPFTAGGWPQPCCAHIPPPGLPAAARASAEIKVLEVDAFAGVPDLIHAAIIVNRGSASLREVRCLRCTGGQQADGAGGGLLLSCWDSQPASQQERRSEQAAAAAAAVRATPPAAGYRPLRSQG